jgi:predicted P-loop ATPase
MKMAKVVRLPVPVPNGDEQDANAERKQKLFDWALGVLKQLGIEEAIRQSKSREALRRITLNVEDAEIVLAIRDVLHPASGNREQHFIGLREGGLKQFLKNRFADLKKDRDKRLRGRDKQQRDWSDDLILDAEGGIKANLANLILILCEAPKWKGVLAHDEFNARVVIRKRPPWGEEKPDTPWTDHHESLTRVWFQREKIGPAAGDVGRAVQAAAKHNPFHPVREYFDSLVWDGVPRLDMWLVTYFHTDDTPYVRAIGPRWLISSVARIYRPGCQVDHVLVLEGPQGKQKSQALRTLPHDEFWFTDRLSHIGGKDAAIEIAGIQIVELAEMDALNKAASSTSKSFLTRRHDRFRPPYGKYSMNLPRQCIFAATINPPVGGYLKDSTGARRFWPVGCHDMIDRDGLETMRDQLWAEAVHRFKNGDLWWLETPKLEALATAEQAARFVVDAWTAPIREWLGDRTDVSIWEALEHALGFSREAWTQSAQNRVVKILTHLGFSRYRPRTSEGRQQRYQRDPISAKNLPPTP